MTPTRSRFAALTLGLVCAATGCVGRAHDLDQPVPEATSLEGATPIVPIYRELTPEQTSSKLSMRQSALRVGAPADGIDEREHFYLAIQKDQLKERWFLSAFLRQFLPGHRPAGAGRWLGTRVVSFRVQNDKLFLFDVDDRKASTDHFDPEMLIEAYPIVSGYAPFERQKGSSRYLLIDPAAGLNRFGVMGDHAASGAEPDRFKVDIAFSQRFRPLIDGASFEQAFVGYRDRPTLPDPSGATNNPFRGAGVLALSLRRYAEGEGFTPAAMAPRPFYFMSDPRRVPNEGRIALATHKWNLKPGMTPIKFLVGARTDFFKDHAALKDVDLFGAIKAGIESWNGVLGFPAFEVAMASPADAESDDEKNFVLLDPDLRTGLAYGQSRTNPNTGEIRGAVMYVSLGWVLAALRSAPAPVATPATTVTAALSKASAAEEARLTWNGSAPHVDCALGAGDELASAFERAVADQEAAGGPSAVATFVQRHTRLVVVHEMGHILGLRHNFKGSVMPPSSSIMDYLRPNELLALDGPGAYDIAAIKHLYGLAPELPTQPFCTDHEVATDPDCARYDRGPDPLANAVADHASKVTELLMSPMVTSVQVDAFLAAQGRLFGYLRAANVPIARRLLAWQEIVRPVRTPLPPAERAAVPEANRPLIDLLAQALYARIVEEKTTKYANILGPVVADPRLHAPIAADLRASILNVDGARSFPLRRLNVDALVSLQSGEALLELRAAQQGIQAARSASPTPDVLLDDLALRIDRALSPYFQ